MKEQTNYVEPPKLSSQLKLKSSHGVGDNVVREMNQIQDSKYTKSLRRDLLGVSGNDPNNSVRQRVKSNTTGSSGEDMNEAMKHHTNAQEKIAEDMLALTRNLKEQTEIANRIIRKDTEVSQSHFYSIDFVLTLMNRIILDRYEIHQYVRSKLCGIRKGSDYIERPLKTSLQMLDVDYDRISYGHFHL